MKKATFHARLVFEMRLVREKFLCLFNAGGVFEVYSCTFSDAVVHDVQVSVGC